VSGSELTDRQVARGTTHVLFWLETSTEVGDQFVVVLQLCLRDITTGSQRGAGITRNNLDSATVGTGNQLMIMTWCVRA
jgi:hypothetical protein